MNNPDSAAGTTGGDDSLPDGTTPLVRRWAPTIDRWASAGLAGTVVMIGASAQTRRRPPPYSGVRIEVGRLAVGGVGAVAASLAVVSVVGWLVTGAAMFASGFLLFAVVVVLYAVMVSRMPSLGHFNAGEPPRPHEG